jgi:hypothetical protein
MKLSREAKRIQKGKDQFYTESSLETRKKIVDTEYAGTEMTLNDFYDGKIKVDELVDKLGSSTLGFNQEHPSSQIYAFDSMFKALTEVNLKDTESTDAILEEIVYDVAVTDNPVKREYMLGILAHFSSKRRLEGLGGQLIEQDIEQKLEDDIHIITSLAASADRLKQNPQLNKNESIVKVLDLIINDFPEGDQEAGTARLVATYYQGEKNATRMPDPPKHYVIDNEKLQRVESHQGDIPKYVYTLPKGYHTSEKKVNEAEDWGIPLLTEAGLQQEDDQGRLSNITVLVDINPQESTEYIKAVREAKDSHDLSRVEQLRNDYKDRVWEELDSNMKDVIGSKKDMIILVQTIHSERQTTGQGTEDSPTDQPEARA